MHWYLPSWQVVAQAGAMAPDELGARAEMMAREVPAGLPTAAPGAEREVPEA